MLDFYQLIKVSFLLLMQAGIVCVRVCREKLLKLSSGVHLYFCISSFQECPRCAWLKVTRCYVNLSIISELPHRDAQLWDASPLPSPMHNLLFHLIYPAVPSLCRRAERSLITDRNTTPFSVHLKIIMDQI